jgi:hypothetical protein
MAEMPDLSTVTFHQRTPVYRYHQYQGQTKDCGPTSLAIAANALLGEDRFQGPVVAQEMNDPAFEVRPFPHFVVRRIQNWATFPWGIVHYLQQHDIPARWSPLGTVNILRRNLLADRLTIVMLGELLHWENRRYAAWGHAKVLFGYAPGQGFLFVDPAYERRPDAPDSWEHYGLFWQEETEFLRQWRGLFSIYVEVG